MSAQPRNPCVRSATADDAALVFSLLRELAEYSGLMRSFKATETDVRRLIFGPNPRVFSDIVEVRGETVGFSIWFYNVNTFDGQAGLYLEDLYVRSAARGTGAGRALMAALARRCRDEGLAAIDWSVMDGNAPGLEFYARLGAKPKSGWTVQSLSGAPLSALASD
jgi:GNAT superfamily N-acetyltransferase